MPEEKLPHNIQNLLMDIGEKSALFWLFVYADNTHWEVFQNLGESGCDILLLNSLTNQRLKLEVKTRQRIYTTSKSNDSHIVHFTLTENEYTNCDFVICYWLEESAFFIVPKSELKPSKNKDKIQYKHIVTKRKDGHFDEKSSLFLGNWDSIIK